MTARYPGSPGKVSSNDPICRLILRGYGPVLDSVDQ